MSIESKDVQNLIDHLANGGKASVKFTKANGNERVMLCTQDTQYIRETDRYWGKTKQLIQVWDLEEDFYRTFNKERVISWHPVA